MTATLPKTVVTGFPVPIAPVAVTTGQICTYTIVLRSLSPLVAETETFPVSFDRPIDDRELNDWLTPWLDNGYELIGVAPLEWRVRNPLTGEYETAWTRAIE
jgi:hypothetical protein